MNTHTRDVPPEQLSQEEPVGRASAAGADSGGSPAGPNPSSAAGDLGDTLLRLRDELEDVVPAGLVVKDDPGLALHGEAALIDLLLIQLVLTVRDMAEPGELDLHVAREGARFARITVRGCRPQAIGEEELVVLCQLAAELEGTVEPVPDGLSVLLPTGAAPRPVVAVGCRDRRVVDTLAAEIVRCGAQMVEIGQGEAPPEGAQLVLAEDELLDHLPPGGWRSVALVPRRPQRIPTPPGSPERHCLGVPLVVGELEAVLRAR